MQKEHIQKRLQLIVKNGIAEEKFIIFGVLGGLWSSGLMRWFSLVWCNVKGRGIEPDVEDCLDDQKKMIESDL